MKSNSPVQQSIKSFRIYLQGQEDNSLIILIVIRVTTQSIHGIQTILWEHVVPAWDQVLLSHTLDRIINGQWRPYTWGVTVRWQCTVHISINTKKKPQKININNFTSTIEINKYTNYFCWEDFFFFKYIYKIYSKIFLF